VVTFPPAVPDITENEEGHGCQVEYTAIQCFGGAFAHLLGGFGTNGALTPHHRRQVKGKNKTTHPQPLFHFTVFWQSYGTIYKLMHRHPKQFTNKKPIACAMGLD